MLSLLLAVTLAVFSSAPPDEVPPHLQKGKELLDRLKKGEAIEFFTAAILARPDDAVAYYYRSLAYNAALKFDEALADSSRAIELDRNFARAYVERGRHLLARKKADEARADLTLAIKLDPKAADPFHWRGRLLYDRAEYREALADFEQGHANDATDRGLYTDLIWTLSTCPDEKVRDGKRALGYANELSKLLVGAPINFSLELTALAHSELGQFKEAVEWQTKAVEMFAGRKMDVLKMWGEERLQKYYKVGKPPRTTTWTEWR